MKEADTACQDLANVQILFGLASFGRPITEFTFRKKWSPIWSVKTTFVTKDIWVHMIDL